ncbi:MAG: hypothetical protein ACLQVK_13915 [Acidimicrobiales bacterium]|jgi:hypothetical protein
MTAALIEATSKYDLSLTARSQPTSLVRQAARHAALFALAAGIGFILLWSATHTSQSTSRQATSGAEQVTTLSSQELLSQLRPHGGSGRPLARAALVPAPVTVVATPLGPQR